MSSPSPTPSGVAREKQAVMKRNCDLVTRATSSVDPSAMAAKPLWQMMARKMPSCYATAQRHDTSNQGGDRGVNGTVARGSA